MTVTAGAGSGSAQKQLVNKDAPDFVLTSFNGKALRLSSYRGKVVLLNFWATWCAPCQVEMPVFAAWQREYGARDLQVVGISMDDEASLARHAVERLNLNYPLAMGNARLASRYGGVLGLPLTFLIDRNGIVRARYQGETELSTIENQIKSLLAAPR
ncbi:Putative thiol-disulfide interchange protein (fragment) [Candidatus Sulfotelmatomonas gaucii]|uniref:Thiol-disulfide interchange protein n=1 Tax=Candidatus Sulfuritelmatomonas gaucii TaxID=2043161 RepID=A0A2N9L624_9BACT